VPKADERNGQQQVQHERIVQMKKGRRLWLLRKLYESCVLEVIRWECCLRLLVYCLER